MRTLVAVLACLALLVACDEEGDGSTSTSSAPASSASPPEPAEAPSQDTPLMEATPEQVAADEAPPPEVARPYDDEADAEADIAAAVARAGSGRVLLVFGANWCVWCRRLEHVLQNDAAVGSALEGFEVVHVSTGDRRSGHQEELNTRYGNPMENGLPVIVVLDGQGEMVTTQETGSLETGDRHDPAKVVEFLNRVRG